jgi:hypothetical protein
MNMNQNENEEELYIASECICDDDGVHYICSKCGKYHDTDLDTVMCCLEDFSKSQIATSK